MSDDYIVPKPPSPVGYWIMPGSVPEWQTRFSAYAKPNIVHRFFMRRLLGWKWIDA